MGLRGLHAKPITNRQQPSAELVVTPACIAIFRRMSRLELECTCTDEMKADVSAEWCQVCTECWRLNGKLCALLGVPIWEFAYWNPRWETRRPMQPAIDRFHLLEAAASRAKKEPKLYKWQR